MRGCRNIATRQSICFLFLWILVLWKSGYVGAELRTIDFDYLPDGTPIGDATSITDAYAEWGVTLSCHGLYPDSPLVDDNNAYAYADSWAFSGNNVMGGRIFMILGDRYHWLNFNLCYGAAEFTRPVDYISIYGAGSPFQVFYYDQHGDKRGPFASPSQSFLDISPETGLVIKKIEFGSYTGDYYTYFDDLTFNTLWPAITVRDSIDPYDDLQVPFGSVTEGSLSEATVTIANDGDDSLIIGAVGTLEAPFSIETDNCSQETLTPGASCTLAVRFEPTTTGTFNDSFDIPSDDPDEDPVTVNVSGTGTAECLDNLDCTPESYCAKSEGICDSMGVCTSRPDDCPLLYNPVCGCDGQTYVNECEAAMSGVSIAYRGEGTPTDLELEAPSNLTANAESHDQIDLTWTENSSAVSGFEIWGKIVPDPDETSTQTDSDDESATSSNADYSAEYSLIDTVGADVTNYSASGLEPYTGYSYRVRAFKSPESSDSQITSESMDESAYEYSDYSNEAEARTSDKCFIATAAYGSLLEPHVATLRRFRDVYLLPSALGRLFVKTYYAYSPPPAGFIAKHETLKAAVRVGLLPLVAISYSTLHFGPIVALTMLVVLLVIPIFLFRSYRRKAPLSH